MTNLLPIPELLTLCFNQSVNYYMKNKDSPAKDNKYTADIGHKMLHKGGYYSDTHPNQI